MEDNLKKYANLLITRCLALKKEQPLLITAPIETIEFVRIVVREALEVGCNDIYFDLVYCDWCNFRYKQSKTIRT